ncbi:hypothetical protein ACFSHP_13335 [Novosphingobium panipatense]
MGETDAARAVLQDLDIADYSPAFSTLAFDVYARTADFTGLCPVMASHGSMRDDAAWNTSRTICEAFRGNSTAAIARLERDRIRGKMDQIDLLLAQKYAGAAGKARRAVTIEWDKVTTMTPWRYGPAIGTGLEPPAALMAQAGPSYDFATALAPMVSLTRRAAAADRAAAEGVLECGDGGPVLTDLRGSVRHGRVAGACGSAARRLRPAGCRGTSDGDEEPVERERAFAVRSASSYGCRCGPGGAERGTDRQRAAADRLHAGRRV